MRLVHVFSLKLHIEGKDASFDFQWPSDTASLAALVPLAYQITDRMMAHKADHALRVLQPITCEPRCTSCCHQLVVLAIPEVLYMRDALHASPERDDLFGRIAQLDGELARREWIEELFDPTFSETPPHIPIGVDYFRASLPCPLLIDDLCSVYEQRPLACRTQSVTSDPKRCANPFDDAVKKVSLGRSLSPALVKAAAELLEQPPCMIPLPLFPRWLRDNAAIEQRRWPVKDLVGTFLRAL